MTNRHRDVPLARSSADRLPSVAVPASGVASPGDLPPTRLLEDPRRVDRPSSAPCKRITKGATRQPDDHRTLAARQPRQAGDIKPSYRLRPGVLTPAPQTQPPRHASAPARGETDSDHRRRPIHFARTRASPPARKRFSPSSSGSIAQGANQPAQAHPNRRLRPDHLRSARTIATSPTTAAIPISTGATRLSTDFPA